MPPLLKNTKKTRSKGKTVDSQHLEVIEESQNMTTRNSPIKSPPKPKPKKKRYRRNKAEIEKDRETDRLAALAASVAECDAESDTHESDEIFDDEDAGGINIFKVFCKNINISFQCLDFCSFFSTS